MSEDTHFEPSGNYDSAGVSGSFDASMQLMLTCRGMEQAIERACLDGRFAGPAHVSLGQESTAAAVAAVRQAEDAFFSSHRGHHHAVAWGLSPESVLAEVIGHQSGVNHGLGGSMHIISPATRFYGTNGVVGDCYGLALGAALTMSIRSPGAAVTFAAAGDGAMGTGIVYEALNLACLWHLPIIFVCEDNGYAEMTPTSVHLATSPAERARAFGLAVFECDGVDVANTIECLRDARITALSGQPAFVHLRVHRWGGHYVGDVARYRPAGEDMDWRDKFCPIRAYGLAQGWPSELVEDAQREAFNRFSQLVDSLLGDRIIVAEAGVDFVEADTNA